MINKVTLIGNLGRDPEVRHLEGGGVVARLAVATNENYKDRAGEWQTKTEWHNVELWGAAAERAERQFKKGNLIYIEGKIQTDKWQDQTGNDRYTTKVRALSIRSLERREQQEQVGAGAANPMGGNFTPMATPAEVPGAKNVSTPPAEGETDLPF
jgi:single-strand DNA-binding protein